MFKCLLFALLILRSGNLFCVDIAEQLVKIEGGELFFEKNLITAIDLIHAGDFKMGYLGCLTPSQLGAYKRQINSSFSTDLVDANPRSPLEYAAFLGEAKVVDWLLLNGAKVIPSNPSKPLKCALKCGLMNWHDQSKTVSALLAAGASTKGLIRGEPFVDFMRRKLNAERRSQAKFGRSDRNAQIIEDMKKALVALQQHERWSPERAAWSGAVLRGGIMAE